MSIVKSITHYCQYQPRCHKEVRNKLYELGCTTSEVEEYISEVITVGLLNEEKYARAFARGKFRIKKWGRVKIIQHLKHNQISEFCIKKGLSEIDKNEYYDTVRKLAVAKLFTLRSDKNGQLKNRKVYSYLSQKGYESQLINEVINEILNEDTKI